MVNLPTAHARYYQSGYILLRTAMAVRFSFVPTSLITGSITMSLLGGLPEFRHYPSAEKVDSWIDSVWDLGAKTKCPARRIVREGHPSQAHITHMHGFGYLRFAPAGMDPFYACWQPALNGPAPLLVHTPGYGSEMSMHPDLAAQGFNVLHVNPMGYATPDGYDESKRRGQENWPVLRDTVETGAREGYRIWLAQCVMAIRWAWKQKTVLANRVSFFGSSQGGGCSLILGSLFKDHGARCVAADVPFLTNFPSAKGQAGAYAMIHDGLNEMPDVARGWHAIGFIDTLSHARRLTMPVLLTAAGDDTTCTPGSIESLFARLPSTRSYTFLQGLPHGYTEPFIPLALGWFRLYA
ncbi:MAG: hypothetical protein GF418_11100 [Chitinivibrionales bacterium]|nr:hypothetical protein [Chitinivibrionales bacterium]MBD3396162.1 hypothetical protein [Chitinivibrionales bacterium]